MIAALPQVYCVAVHERVLFSGSWDFDVRAWDTATGEGLGVFQGRSPPTLGHRVRPMLPHTGAHTQTPARSRTGAHTGAHRRAARGPDMQHAVRGLTIHATA